MASLPRTAGRARGRALRSALLAAACAVLICACGSAAPKSAAPDAATVRRALTGAPPPLAELHRQANRLLGGGRAAFKRRLATLRGHPVVVNDWGSWCGPCRVEFPYFQVVSVERGRRVAFLGVDTEDNDGAARDFLADYPVTYPSFKDPEGDVAHVFHAGAAFPSTAFYDSQGRLSYLHQGPYDSAQALTADVDRYAK
jgi:thiol-disulfide isomerase/thioredoxin